MAKKDNTSSIKLLYSFIHSESEMISLYKYDIFYFQFKNNMDKLCNYQPGLGCSFETVA